MKIKKILLPVDGSDGSLIALETAKDMAKKFQAEIILLNVVDIANRGSVHEFYAYDPVVEESLVKRGCKILDDTEARFKKSGNKAPIISDRKEIRKNEFLTGYKYDTSVNLDDGELNNPAGSGEDPQLAGTDFEKEVSYEKHGRMYKTQIKEGELDHPAAAGEDPNFEGTEFQKKELFENRNKFNEINENNNTLDKDDPMYMSRNDEMIDKDLPVDHASNKDGSVYMSRNDEMIDKNLPMSDHNSAVPERRGPVGVENSPRVNTKVSPELKGDIHPNQMNPHFVDDKSNINQMGLEKDETRHDTANHSDNDVKRDVLREDAQLIGNGARGYENDDIVIKKVSLTGQAGETIVDFSDKHNIDLIIMASRGSSRVRRFFIGSVTNYVLHHSRVPLLTIPVKDDIKE